LRTAVERLDDREIGRLNQLVETLNRANAAFDSVERDLGSGTPTTISEPSRKRVELRVTGGDIRRSLLRVTDLRRAGFDLPLGKELRIETVAPCGIAQFRTSIAEPPRLRARREIAAFYREAHVREGDTILFEEIAANTYRVSKKSPEVSKGQQLDREFLSGVEKNLSEWNSENDEQAYADLSTIQPLTAPEQSERQDRRRGSRGNAQDIDEII